MKDDSIQAVLRRRYKSFRTDGYNHEHLKVLTNAADRIEQLQMPHAEVLKLAELDDESADTQAMLKALCKKIEAQKRELARLHAKDADRTQPTALPSVLQDLLADLPRDSEDWESVKRARAYTSATPPSAPHRDALIKIRDRTRSDPADFETAFRDLREIYTLCNMTLTDSGDLFTRPADETPASLEKAFDLWCDGRTEMGTPHDAFRAGWDARGTVSEEEHRE